MTIKEKKLLVAEIMDNLIAKGVGVNLAAQIAWDMVKSEENTK